MSFIVAGENKNDKDNENGQPLGTAALIFRDLPQSINLFVVLVVVAIPEGLPLTIQISLAFSVMRMYSSDNILLKKQDALEKIAEI